MKWTASSHTIEREGKEGFSVWPEGRAREEYTAIIYLEPETPSNKFALGFDMFTEPVRRQAMETARDTGKPTASGRVKLVQERGFHQQQSGFLIYAPVYRNNMPVSNEAERRAALLGYVYSPYRIDDFLARITAEKNYDVAFQVYDGAEPRPENLFSSANNDAAKEPLFTKTQNLDVAGRTWTFMFATKPSFHDSSSQPLSKYTIIIGVLLSFLFFAVTRAEIRARTRAERAAEEVKHSETTIRKTLTERERAEEELRKTTDALREADQRALLEYERLLERIKALAQALGTARELTAIFRALRAFTNSSIPCNGFFVSLYDRASRRSHCLSRVGRWRRARRFRIATDGRDGARSKQSRGAHRRSDHHQRLHACAAWSSGCDRWSRQWPATGVVDGSADGGDGPDHRDHRSAEL